jgi:hypothetical protein
MEAAPRAAVLAAASDAVAARWLAADPAGGASDSASECTSPEPRVTSPPPAPESTAAKVAKAQEEADTPSPSFGAVARGLFGLGGLFKGFGFGGGGGGE